jgi:hypothetical protein
VPANIYFFNPVSFYCYIKDSICFGRQSIEDVVNRIEPYIPLRLTEDNFEMFLDNMLDVNGDNEIGTDLMTKVKGDFIYAMLGANSPEMWAELTGSCESIRHMKESKLYQNLI